MLTLLSNIQTYSKFCLTSVQAFSEIIIVLFAIYLIGSRFYKQLVISIASTQNQLGSPLLISSKSFIYISILQHHSAILFSLCMYDAAYPIFISCFQQKLWRVALINSLLPSVCKQSSLLPQVSALGSQSLNVLKNSSLLFSKKIHDLRVNSLSSRFM